MPISIPVLNWSRIRRITGPTGTYALGSADRTLADPEWARALYRQAAGFGFSVRVKDGDVYLDARP